MAKINLIEKESEVSQHTTGRNSGVLHAGFYYQTESLKA
jgi:L-2-hydroxyglutarate oxidase LhgO